MNTSLDERGLAAEPRGVSLNSMWLCLGLWALSFALPAARIQGWGTVDTWFGWQVALDSLLLLFVPIKGTLLGFFIPHTWTVFANFFIGWAPFKARRLQNSNGHTFATALVIAAATPVSLVYLPKPFQEMVHGFEIGFVLWSLAIVGTSASFSWTVWKNRIALIPNAFLAAALLCGLLVWSPYLTARRYRVDQQRQENAVKADLPGQREAIAKNGLLAFSEPVTNAQEQVLESYILAAQKFSSEALIAASQHYRDGRVMSALAAREECPPAALEVLFQHAIEKKNLTPAEKTVRNNLYLQVARHPNTSQDLLVRMLESDDPVARTVALRSGKLPANEELPYLKRGCSVMDEDEMLAIARDTDTPEDVLGCLAKNPAAAIELAANPHTPTAELERLSESSDLRIASQARMSLAKRKQQGK